MATYKDKILSQEPNVYYDPATSITDNFGTNGGVLGGTPSISETVLIPMRNSGLEVPLVRSSSSTSTVLNLNSPDLTTWTLSFLLTKPNSNNAMSLLAFNQQFSPFQFSTSGRYIRYRYYSSSGSLNTTYYSKQMDSVFPSSAIANHYTLRRSGGSSVSVFKNGTFVAIIPTPYMTPSSDYISWYNVIYSSYYNGPTYGHVAVWNRALTDEEISEQANYNGESLYPHTVLESGTEVPVEIEGEYTSSPDGNQPATITPLTIDGVYNGTTQTVEPL